VTGAAASPGFFPGRAPIEAYGNGGFRFAGMGHRGSILCLPSGIRAWEPATPGVLSEGDFVAAIAEAGGIEVLLIGTGERPMPLAPELREMFRRHAIVADAMTTGAAARTYNVLLGEGRAVAAAMVAVP
jgi:uncharacterized protein